MLTLGLHLSPLSKIFKDHFFRLRVWLLEYRWLVHALAGSLAGLAASTAARDMGLGLAEQYEALFAASMLSAALLAFGAARAAIQSLGRILLQWFACLGFVVTAAAFGVGWLAESPVGSPLTMPQIARELVEAADSLVSLAFLLWTICFIGECLRAKQGLSAISRNFAPWMVARHEAGHALAAVVLGIPISGAVSHWSPRGRIGGAVSTPCLPPATSLPHAQSDIVKLMALLVAGVLAERLWKSTAEAYPHFETQSDWERATFMRMLSPSIGPDQDALAEVTNAVREAFASPPWRAAIEEGSRALLLAGGEWVAPQVFADIARRHALSLSRVDCLIEQAAKHAEKVDA